MALPETVQARISSLRSRFSECGERMCQLIADDQDPEFQEVRGTEFMAIFRDVRVLVEESEASSVPYLEELLDAVQEVLKVGTEIAHGESDLHPLMPSWAHDDERGRPLLKDQSEFIPPIPLTLLPQFFRIFGINEREAKKKIKEIRPSPWNEPEKRHPDSTRLARFRKDLPPTLTATSTSPRAMSVYDARCEITSTSIFTPFTLHLTEGNSCLFTLGMTGYKERIPGLKYCFLDKNDETNSVFHGHYFKAGLSDVAHNMAVDESQCLVLLGDRRRVKSYAWGNPDGTYYEELAPVHTLNSKDHSGPIAVLPDGSIVRAGEGGVAVWKGVETHGDEGKQIGESIDMEETWRDDPSNIEPSSGSNPTSLITFLDHPNLKPAKWKQLVESPSTLVCLQDTWDSPNYTCVAIDLEAGGKTRGRYLGHSGQMTDIAVSAADPRVFLTACSDGFARLYDVRQSLPVLTFDSCGQSEACEAVALAHPDGIPTVFTGNEKHENIIVWDVRARAAVYELATGNNAVESLAWDSKRNCLYAATRCSYRDRMGYHHDYHRARIRKDKSTHTSSNVEDENPDEDEDEYEDVDEDEDDDSDEYYEDATRCWPDRARHPEDYFGYMFDAGNHRIYRYAFKENPAPNALPRYGNATLSTGGMW